MRLFIAVNFDDETKERIKAVQDRLRAVSRGSFTHTDNFHLTLVFIGEVHPNQVASIRQAMDDTAGAPTELTFDHTGCFRRDGGDIWWIGLKRNVVLEKLHHDLSDKLTAQGFNLQDRQFKPHVTLARRVVPEREVDRSSLLGDPFATGVSAISLMKSEHIQGKLTYTEIYRKKL
ncbi:MAG TPA: RNA 2',3'-cyclic phosphodiesterase [Candidatus Atribacteria bacterium]|nr:RNA 2',3'-cyclic phosphodiesterase [Candidatus Atribacteria bacterium]HPT77984.1 RNA 2',3'-cyclic phosphodiesterase [Candidatus Atribacteria bacterium]